MTGGVPMTLMGVALVADGDPDRGKAIAEACAVRGLATRFAAHGAEALEAALAEPPDVVIAAFDLPLIAAAQLAGILRANPRTHCVRFLVVGGPPGRTFGTPAIDSAVDAPVDPEVVLRRVESLLAREGTGGEAPPADDARNDLEGNLAQLALADLLQLFHMNRKTGCAELVRQGPDGAEERGVVFVSDGNVVDARCGAAGAEKALLRLLAWRNGSFAFRRMRPGASARIHTPTRALLLEGMRQVDEMARLRAELPPLDAEIVLLRSPAAGPSAPSLTREVLSLLRSGLCVGDLLDRSVHPDYQVLRTLHALSERGTIALRATASSTTDATGQSLFSGAQLGRLRAWAHRRDPAGAPASDGRALLVSSDPQTTRAFLALLAKLPEVSLDRAFREGRFSGSTLRRVGRLGPPASAGIEILHLPALPSCEPLWTLASASALGLIALVGSVRGEGVRAVQTLQRAIDRDGRLRSCWVLVERTAQPRSSRALASALGLRPDTALLRLSAAGERSDDRSALVRLVSSLVP
ncbi:MAG: DUF4388 domain-containing protein [Deltaproteobacteria bacterium]|nr:DUF4388 domain-containing protein [Deltaproteobacteria bacterium]